METNETVLQSLVFRTHKTPVLLFLKFIFLFFLLNFLLLSILMFGDLFDITIVADIKFGVLILAMFLCIIFFVFQFLAWLLEVYTIQEGRIIHKRGIFIKRVRIFTINDINSMALKQSFLGRICNYSTVEISYNEKVVSFKYINYPNDFINTIDIFKTNNTEDLFKSGVEV